MYLKMLEIQKIPRQYDWIVNGYKITVVVPPWDDEGIHPKDILIKDLETAIETLKSAETFKLPPLSDASHKSP